MPINMMTTDYQQQHSIEQQTAASPHVILRIYQHARSTTLHFRTISLSYNFYTTQAQDGCTVLYYTQTPRRLLLLYDIFTIFPWEVPQSLFYSTVSVM
jgi:hypothetical protein